MALTQAAVNAWRTAVDRQAQILENGLATINAQAAKKEIPQFKGDIENKLAIEEWLQRKCDERRMDRCTKKLRFLQEKLTKAAANFNDSLTPAQKTTYQLWKTSIITGLTDLTTKVRKKEGLNTLKQKDTERVRDFKIKIDDLYRIS
jgi:hypothetical protein